jgi:hypothetical protein
VVKVDRVARLDKYLERVTKNRRVGNRTVQIYLVDRILARVPVGLVGAANDPIDGGKDCSRGVVVAVD